MSPATRPAVLRAIAASVLLLSMALVWRVAAWHPLPVTLVDLPDAFVRVSGVAHVHTAHSDGSGEVVDVEAAAAAAGLDFVIITDHNSLAGKTSEGYGPAGVLTVVGTEISNREGHLLAVGLPQLTYRFSGEAGHALRDVADVGGMSFAAHPESDRQDLRWKNWQLPGPWGVELLNGDSQWRAAGWFGLLGALARYPLNQDYALLRLLRRPATLDRWDTVLSRRAAVGITGADAHGTLTTLSRALPFPSYEAVFRIAQNYVLLDKPLGGTAAEDSAALLDALAKGRLYVGIGALAPADRFFFHAERADERWTMGETLPATGPVRLRAGGALPMHTRLTLFHNGTALTSEEGPIDQRVIEPGVYRVEAHVPGWEIPWIVSNPIYVLTEEDRARRRRAAALPEPPVVGETVQLERFETSSTFTAVADETSTFSQRFIDAGAGADGSAAARVAFQLGRPTEDHPSPFVSLVSYVPRDLSGRDGLVFAVRSDRPYRFWVQVRDLHPTEPEGADTWQASVRSSTEWQDVSVPFDDLRNVIDDDDGTLDLGDAQAIVFLVDTGAVEPGTDGTIWIDDLRVY
jgi:hypothetical protein